LVDRLVACFLLGHLMKPRLIESRPPGTPLARQRWECSACSLQFEPNFTEGMEMTIRRRIELMKKSFKAHLLWHEQQDDFKPTLMDRMRRAIGR
jgi:hypothetical protein